MFGLAERMNHYLGDYDLIVGDDPSGRLPALYVRELVNKRRAEQGLRPAAIRFVRGRSLARIENAQALTSGDFIPGENMPDARTVLVTEQIQSGHTMAQIYETVSQKRRASKIDIASLNSDYTADQLREQFAYSLDSSIYIGTPPELEEVPDDFLPDWNRASHHFRSPTESLEHSGTLAKGVTRGEGMDEALFTEGLPGYGEKVSWARYEIALIASAFYRLLPPI